MLLLLPPGLARSPHSLSLSVSQLEAETLGRAAVRHCRRSEPPPTNRRHRNLRRVVFYLPVEPRIPGRPPSPAIVEIPRLRHWASPSIASPSSLPVPLRAHERLQGEIAHPLDLSSLSPVPCSVGSVRFRSRRSSGSPPCAIAAVLVSDDLELAAPPLYGSRGSSASNEPSRSPWLGLQRRLSPSTPRGVELARASSVRTWRVGLVCSRGPLSVAWCAALGCT